MKRERATVSEGGGVTSLQSLVLHKIVSSFQSKEAFLFYVSAIPFQPIKNLLNTLWDRKEQMPNQTLIHTRRRVVGAELVIHYVETRELVETRGIITQTTRAHTTPISIESVDANLIDLVVGRMQLHMEPSKTHRKPRFILF